MLASFEQAAFTSDKYICNSSKEMNTYKLKYISYILRLCVVSNINL